MTKTRRPPVRTWPDAHDAERVVCEGTAAVPGCGASFGATATHPDTGRRSGRDRCPHCGARRAIPAEHHAVYVQWFGLVQQHAMIAVRRGGDYEAAFDALHDMYVTAVLRWVPEVAAFSTFATHVLKGAARYGYVYGPANTPEPCGDLRGGHERAAFDPAFDDLDDTDDVRTELAALAGAMNELPDRTRDILAMRFGLSGEPHTLAQIGARYGLSRQRVQQIIAAAVTRLRRAAV